MTEIGGQDRKAGTGVACPVAIDDGVDGEAVPKIVDPGSACRRARRDAAMMQQFPERRLHVPVAQPSACRTDQQGRRARLAGAIIAAQVVVQGRDGGRVQRQFAGLAELAVADRKPPWAASKSSSRGRSPRRPACRLPPARRSVSGMSPARAIRAGSSWPASGPRPPVARRGQVLPGALAPGRRSAGGTSVPGVECVEVSGEEADLRQSPGVPACGGPCGTGCPGQRSLGPDMRLAAAFDEGDDRRPCRSGRCR